MTRIFSMLLVLIVTIVFLSCAESTPKEKLSLSGEDTKMVTDSTEKQVTKKVRSGGGSSGGGTFGFGGKDEEITETITEEKDVKKYVKLKITETTADGDEIRKFRTESVNPDSPVTLNVTGSVDGKFLKFFWKSDDVEIMRCRSGRNISKDIQNINIHTFHYI